MSNSFMFVTYSPDTGQDILTFAGETPGDARSVVATPLDEQYPRLSADGRWLSYSSQGKLYVVPFPDGGERAQVSANSKTSRWSATTSELFYIENGKLVSLRYEVSGNRFRPIETRALLELPGRRTSDEAFAVSRDAQRFLFLIEEPARDAVPDLRVLTDGFAALRGAPEARK